MNDVYYMAHSHLQAHFETPGHGKLLWDPNLQVSGTGCESSVALPRLPGAR